MHKTVILIVGPTAVGKTAASIQLAQHFSAEIISADSRQCFREISIGVAKPATDELQLIKHHFIHSHSVQDEMTAAIFETYALQAVEQIFEKHDVAVMVGGTGLYIKAFCEGMDAIPAIADDIRNELKRQYKENGIEWLQHQLAKLDPLYAASGEMQNPQRLMRALEVLMQTGQSIITYQKGIKQKRNFNIIKTGLDLPREELYDRINLRVDQMMKEGLLKEAESVYHLRHLNALQTVGYRELFDYFDGKLSLDDAVAKIKQNTRHYAKRQLTWFRRDDEIKWFHPSQTNEMIKWTDDEITRADQY